VRAHGIQLRQVVDELILVARADDCRRDAGTPQRPGQRRLRRRTAPKAAVQSANAAGFEGLPGAQLG